MKIILILLSFKCLATDFTPYKETDNQSMNKFERIGSIEKYLSGISETLKSLDEKIDLNSKQIKEMSAAKISKDKTSTPAAVDNSLLVKIQTDFDSLKKDDLKKMRDDITVLQSDIQFIKEILKSNKSF